MLIKFQPDPETQRRIIEAAVKERRPVRLQAEILLRRAVGLPDPIYAPPANQRVDCRTGAVHAV